MPQFMTFVKLHSHHHYKDLSQELTCTSLFNINKKNFMLANWNESVKINFFPCPGSNSKNHIKAQEKVYSNNKKYTSIAQIQLWSWKC